MELSILAAGIHVNRQIGQESLIEIPTREGPIEHARVDAGDDRFEAQVYEGLREWTSIPLPQRKHRFHADLGQIVLPVAPNVLQEDVSESDGGDAEGQVLLQELTHGTFVSLVGGALRNGDRFQGKAKGISLPVQENSRNAVHADPVILLGHDG